MTTVNVYEAKSSFSRLIALAEKGETVVIARNGRPVAQLGPLAPASRPVVFGDMKGKLSVADDFDSWTDDDEDMWYGDDVDPLVS